MAATERVVVLMTKSQKSEVAARARSAKLAVGDFMRRAALGEEDAAARELLAEVRESTAKAGRALDRTLVRLASADKALAGREAAIARQARKEFSAADAEAFLDLIESASGVGAAPARRRTAATKRRA